MKQQYENLVTASPSLEDLSVVAPLKPFAQQTFDFIDALSSSIMQSASARKHPELMALAFWMRKANLTRLAESFYKEIGDRIYVPRGTVFHVAPSNVDTIFVYSWFLAMLSGCRNIVRLSSKRTEQAIVLTDLISDLLEDLKHQDIAKRTLLVRYPADNSITADFSAACDVRVIWGGNSTVEQIRAIPIPAAAMDIAFSNKYSIALIHAERWLTHNEGKRDAEVNEFWNDAYWFDQMGCSSPRLVLWVGEVESVQKAAKDFWSRLDALLTKKQTRFSDADYVNKLMAADSLAIDSCVRIDTGTANNLVRVWLDTPALHINYHCGAGLFLRASYRRLLK